MDLVQTYSYTVSDRNHWIEIGRFRILEIKLGSNYAINCEPSDLNLTVLICWLCDCTKMLTALNPGPCLSQWMVLYLLLHYHSMQGNIITQLIWENSKESSTRTNQRNINDNVWQVEHNHPWLVVEFTSRKGLIWLKMRMAVKWSQQQQIINFRVTCILMSPKTV